MARRLILFSFALVLSVSTFAQNANGLRKIAPFQILLNTGQSYSASQLKPGAVVLVYFSPDCDHCQAFTVDMLKNINAVGNKQVVMVTPAPMDMLKPFVSKYNLASYPNIKLGTEGTSRVVQRYYNIMHYPYIVLYDKTGKLVKTFEGEQPHAEIFKAMKSI